MRLLTTMHRMPRMINFSNVASAGTTIAYLIDTHGAGASHIIALVDFARAMLSYGVTFFANGVVLGRGVKVSLLISVYVNAGPHVTCLWSPATQIAIARKP